MSRADMEAKVRLTGDASGANAAIKSTDSAFTKLGTKIRASKVAIVATLAALAGAFKLVKDSAEQAGQATAFQSGLAAQGIAADEFIAKLQKVSDSQIANADLVLATNRAIALGIKADDLPALLETAAQASVKLGISVTQAFNDITTGVGRASPLILDNLGIVVDSARVYGDYAESIGKTVEELTKQERTQALTTSVIKGGLDTTKSFTEAQDSMTVAINKSAAAMSNLKQSAGTVVGGLAQLAASGLTATTLAVIQGAEAFVKLGRAILFLGKLIPGLTQPLSGASEKLREIDDDIDGLQERTKSLAVTLAKGAISSIQYGLGLKEIEAKASLAAPAIEEVTASVKEAAKAAADSGGDFDEFGDALDGSASSADGVRAAMTLAKAGIAQAGVQARITSAEFDRLSDSIGRTAAVAASLDAGGTLSQGGTRLRLPGGGSRLVNTSGTNSSSTSSYSLSPIGTGGRNTVDPDGTLRPR